MNLRRAVSCLSFLCLALAARAVAARAIAQDSPAIDQAELVLRTQQLYDAIPSGDQAPWRSYYAEDTMVYDEKGRAMNKRALLDDLQPMPAGYSGIIKVTHPRATFAPGVAVLAYDCDETETIFGQELHAGIILWIRGCIARASGRLRSARPCATTRIRRWALSMPRTWTISQGCTNLPRVIAESSCASVTTSTCSVGREQRPSCFQSPATSSFASG